MKRISGRDTYITCLVPPPELRREFMRVAAFAPENAHLMREGDLHITLNELQIPKKRCKADLLERLEKIRFPAFDIQMTDIDTFNRVPGTNRRSKVAWLRPNGFGSHMTQELHNAIFLTLRPVGYAVGSVHIRPHMTVLKYGFNENAAALQRFLVQTGAMDFPPWHVDRFYLARRLPLKEQMAQLDIRGGESSRYEFVGEFGLHPHDDIKLQGFAAPPSP